MSSSNIPGGPLGLGRNLSHLSIHFSSQIDMVSLFQGQQLVAANVELVSLFERCRLDTFLRLDGKVDLVDGSQNFVHFAYGRLFLVRKCPITNVQCSAPCFRGRWGR